MGNLPNHQQIAHQKPQASVDTLNKVGQHMAKLHVAGLPRNYELFHEALFGSDAALTRDVLALGAHPTQLHLDQIGLKHRLIGHCGLAEDKMQREAGRILRELSEQLASGIVHKQTFSRALETIIRSIREDENRSLGELLAELDFLTAAASDLTHSETELSQMLKQGLTQIEAADKAAQAAQAAILRDRLTGLPNRIAFFNRLETLYNSDSNPEGTALIVATIEQFQSISNSYGDEAVNRLLKRLSAIFRKTIKKNDFVARIGPDEFAFLFGDVTPDAARVIAERLHSAVSDNLVFATEDGSDNGSLHLSMGFALSDDANSSAQLVSHAEAALASARTNRRSPVVGYPPEHAGAKARRVA